MQRNFHPLSLFILVLLSIVLAGCGIFSLAADVTPPPDYTPQPPAIDQPIAASTAFPLLAPNPAAGKDIFAVKCEPCHGATGLGDGPKAGGLPSRPPLIGSRDLALLAKPADWFTVVSDGRLENFMPGFKGSLDDRQRWDVVAYVLTLSQTQTELEQGKAVYEQQCAACHGKTGMGDGEKAAGLGLADWSKQNLLAQLSAQDIAAITAAGQGEMPAFGSLSQEDRLAAAAYIRSLTFESSAQETGAAAVLPTPDAAASTPAGSAATPATGSTTPGAQTTMAAGGATPAAQASEAHTTLVIRGKITAQGEGIDPGNQKVILFGYEGMNQVMEKDTTSAADGTYEFSVENKTGMAYMVQVDYKGYTYNSDILHSQDVLQSPSELPVTIYATTTDTSAISIDRMHVFFDFSVPNTVQVVELFIISNSGPAVVVSAGQDSPALNFRLPTGANNLQFESGAIGDRYVQTADGFGDLAAIAPGQGQHQVLFSYDMTYDKKLELAIPVPMNVAAAVVMMPQGGVSLQSAELVASGSRDVQGATYDLFTASNLDAGSELRVSLNGKVRAATSSANPSTTTGLLVGLGAFGMVLIGAGIWILQKRGGLYRVDANTEKSAVLETESVESLLDAILALDDLHQAGKLPEEAYQQRRTELKARLKALKG
jgi:mono/diheme cytochrome c family protein